MTIPAEFCVHAAYREQALTGHEKHYSFWERHLYDAAMICHCPVSARPRVGEEVASCFQMSLNIFIGPFIRLGPTVVVSQNYIIVVIDICKAPVFGFSNSLYG